MKCTSFELTEKQFANCKRGDNGNNDSGSNNTDRSTVGRER